MQSKDAQLVFSQGQHKLLFLLEDPLFFKVQQHASVCSNL